MCIFSLPMLFFVGSRLFDVFFIEVFFLRFVFFSLFSFLDARWRLFSSPALCFLTIRSVEYAFLQLLTSLSLDKCIHNIKTMCSFFMPYFINPNCVIRSRWMSLFGAHTHFYFIFCVFPHSRQKINELHREIDNTFSIFRRKRALFACVWVLF